MALRQEDVAPCFYCGLIPDLLDAQTDHVIPVVRGGRDTPENKVPACAACNCSKGRKLPSEWRSDLPAHVIARELAVIDAHGEVKPLPFMPTKSTDRIVGINVAMPEDERDALRDLATKNGVSMSDVIRWLLEKETKAHR